MSKLCDSVDYNNLHFKYVDPKNNDVSFMNTEILNNFLIQ